MTGTCDMEERISVIMERQDAEGTWPWVKTDKMGRMRRTRRGRDGVAQLARYLGASSFVVLLIVGSHTPRWFMAKRRAPRASFSYAAFSRACLWRVPDEFYATRFFTGSLLTSEHLVQRVCDLSRRRAWKAQWWRTLFVRRPKHRLVPLRRRLNFETVRVL